MVKNSINKHYKLPPIELSEAVAKEWLKHLKPIGKAKATLIKFGAKEIKGADITRFKNLYAKLKVEVEVVEMPKKLKGRVADLIVIDEVCKWKK